MFATKSHDIRKLTYQYFLTQFLSPRTHRIRQGGDNNNNDNDMGGGNSPSTLHDKSHASGASNATIDSLTIGTDHGSSGQGLHEGGNANVATSTTNAATNAAWKTPTGVAGNTSIPTLFLPSKLPCLPNKSSTTALFKLAFSDGKYS